MLRQILTDIINHALFGLIMASIIIVSITFLMVAFPLLMSWIFTGIADFSFMPFIDELITTGILLRLVIVGFGFVWMFFTIVSWSQS